MNNFKCKCCGTYRRRNPDKLQNYYPFCDYECKHHYPLIRISKPKETLEVEEQIENLKRVGEIYEPKKGFLQKM